MAFPRDAGHFVMGFAKRTCEDTDSAGGVVLGR